MTKPTDTDFRERARGWLVRVIGWVSPSQDESLGRELKSVYEEGIAEGERAPPKEVP